MKCKGIINGSSWHNHSKRCFKLRQKDTIENIHWKYLTEETSGSPVYFGSQESRRKPKAVSKEAKKNNKFQSN